MINIRTMADKLLEFAGAKSPVPYPSGVKTMEALVKDLEWLANEEKRFVVECFVEDEKIKLRDAKIARLNHTITIDDVMRWKQAHGLCQSMSVWLTEE